MKTLNRHHLTALLALSIAAPTFAQSSVTLYGNVDTGALYMSNYSNGVGYLPSSINSGSGVRIKDGGLGASHWGIKGSEDLGGGLRALFQVQGNINSANGGTGGANSSSQTSFFNQMSTVGLAGSFGELKVGRQFSPVAWAMQHTDVRGMRYFGSTLTALVGMNSASSAWIGNNSNTAFGTIYNDNAVRYTTPTFANVTLDFSYAFGESGGKANSQQGVSAMYSANGLKLSALVYNGYGNNYSTAVALGTAASGGNSAAGAAMAAKAGFSPKANTNRLYGLGAMYAFGSYTVGGQYFMARNPDKVIVPGGSDSLDMWDLGAAWRVSPVVNLSAAYYHIKDNSNSGHKSTQFVLGMEYYLSKRSWLYLQSAWVTNKGNNMALSPMYASPVAANKNVRAVMAGIRHGF
ncbi:porin [Comamonas resistens]|uniref:porin n=1 Tax=Comamonas resistens TaxID=3046670 RepID=UPI0039BD5113